MNLTYANGVANDTDSAEIITCDWNDLGPRKMTQLGGLVYLLAERMHEQGRSRAYIDVRNVRCEESTGELLERILIAYTFFQRMPK